MDNRKVILFSAPSGCGKTTIIKQLLQHFDCFEFSISATSRKPREGEQDGRDYYFLSLEEFESRVQNDQFLEWEEVYQGTRYGTLKSELERIWSKGHVVIFDVDVKGGVNIKKFYGDRAMSLFIQPPSIEALSERLHGRGTDSEEVIQQRLDKAAYELTFAPQFDKVIINDDLDVAKAETLKIVSAFIDE